MDPSDILQNKWLFMDTLNFLQTQSFTDRPTQSLMNQVIFS